MRLDQAARSIFLTEFVSAFFLALRYFFKPKVTLNYPFMKRVNLAPLSRRALRCGAIRTERSAASPASCARWICPAQAITIPAGPRRN